MGALVRVHHANLAMINEAWFHDDMPAGWRRIGRLQTRSRLLTAGDNVVSLFATSQDGEADARAALESLAAAVGPAARITVSKGSTGQVPGGA
jgi:hypothetical protein